MSSDFLIITALQEETDAIVSKLGARKVVPSEDDVHVYYSASVKTEFPDNSKGAYVIVIAPLLGMGRVQAATATVDAIGKWKPAYVLVVGIAGGVLKNGVQLGDVVIGEQIVDYELQKLTDSNAEIRPKTYNADPRLLGAARSIRGTRWQRTMPTRPTSGAPKVRTAPVASGDKVVASEIVLSELLKSIPKLAAVEMEAAGVSAAAFESPTQPGVLVIRAISDLADSNKSSPAVLRWRSYACALAASYTAHFLKSGPIPVSSSAPSMNDGQPMPQADPHRFSIGIAHLLRDRNGEMERLLVEALRDFAGVQLLQVDRTITPEGPIPEEAERAGHAAARGLLAESSAQVLIWGTVLSHDNRTAPRLFWTTAPAGIHAQKPYVPVNFELPQLFWQDLVAVLQLVATTSSTALLARRGEFLGAELVPFVDKVENLLRDGQITSKWTADTHEQIAFICALGLEMLGEQSGTAAYLERSIAYYRTLVARAPVGTRSVKLEQVQHNLGVSLGALGAMSEDGGNLQEAVSIFRSLIDRGTQCDSPELWASAQSNLGSALVKLAEKESGIERARSAAHSYREAMTVWTKDRFPLDWGALQNNLGYVLQLIGKRSSEHRIIIEAIASYLRALDVWTREQVPLFWARAQNSLGNAYKALAGC